MSDMNETSSQQPAQQAASAQPATAPQQAAPSATQVPPAGQMPPAGGPSGPVPPAPGAVPPMGQMPPQQPYGAMPQPAPAPQNVPGMPLLYLTGGMKFGWAVVGLFMGPIAILIAWLVNAHNFPQAKSEAVKFALIGFLASFVMLFLVIVLFGFAACAAIGSLGGMYYYS